MRLSLAICFPGVISLALALNPASPHPQTVLQNAAHTTKQRPLHGRFLHITDFHPDRFYEVYSSTTEEAACHRGQGPAGLYGAETSECDSPVSLINATMRWVEQELKDKIDFVVWTGDSARHDNDEALPRSDEQVVGLNEFLVSKMFEVFGKHNGDEDDDDPNNDYILPIVPNFGNNDILPHNVMTAGPNTWTRTYAHVWRQFIPEVQRHQFEQGGWFYVEVIPNKLAVFSLNTLYFFTSNGAVDGCAAKSEPGYRQMEWLRIQLQFMRERGMKAILSGHVPPARQEAKTIWDETCWQKYTLWLQQYRDVIVASVYGHFNYDHFVLQDFEQVDEDTKRGRMPDYQAVGLGTADTADLHTAVSSDYFIELRDEWAKLPHPPESVNSQNDKHNDVVDIAMPSKDDKAKRKRNRYLRQVGGRYAERFAASFVSASIVPNLYPTLRVFEYNISGLDHTVDHNTAILRPRYITDRVQEAGDVELLRTKKNAKHRFDIPEPPSKSAPPGPAYSPQTLSLLKYTQYFANLTHINNDFEGVSAGEEMTAGKWREGMHKGKNPHGKDHTPHPRKFEFQVEYDTMDDEVYKLRDLTMPNLVDLARRIGNFEPQKASDLPVSNRKKKGKKDHEGKPGKHSKRNEAWFTFIQRAFVGTIDPEQLENEFGR